MGEDRLVKEIQARMRLTNCHGVGVLASPLTPPSPWCWCPGSTSDTTISTNILLRLWNILWVGQKIQRGRAGEITEGEKKRPAIDSLLTNANNSILGSLINPVTMRSNQSSAGHSIDWSFISTLALCLGKWLGAWAVILQTGTGLGGAAVGTSGLETFQVLTSIWLLALDCGQCCAGRKDTRHFRGNTDQTKISGGIWIW